MSKEEKNFDEWNTKKKTVHHDGNPAFCHSATLDEDTFEKLRESLKNILFP